MADSYDDYLQRLGIEDVLRDAGYVRNLRDGVRYPSYVRLDGSGRRIRGDKFIVTRGGRFCFHPPVQKSYNVISLIKDYPHMFSEYSAGMNTDLLVNLVCRRLLGSASKTVPRDVPEPVREQRPFDIGIYSITPFTPATRKMFYPYFRPRGISLDTQTAFASSFVLAERKTDRARVFRNLSFPLTVPGGDGRVVGFEERGRIRRDGGKPYKGKALGSNASVGLWMASAADTPLESADRIMIFESAYDAMAYWQLHAATDDALSGAVFVSTGGTPTRGQMTGLLQNAPKAEFHLCFDSDAAGELFVSNFSHLAAIESSRYGEDAGNGDVRIVRELPAAGYKDFNDELLGRAECVEVCRATGGDLDGDGTVDAMESELQKQRLRR